MKFASDNRAGVSPEILDALAREAGGFGGAYGEVSPDGEAHFPVVVAKIGELMKT